MIIAVFRNHLKLKTEELEFKDAKELREFIYKDRNWYECTLLSYKEVKEDDKQ